MPQKTPKSRSGLSVEQLLEQAEKIKLMSDDLIRQMKELASEIAEAKARREDDRSKRNK